MSLSLSRLRLGLSAPVSGTAFNPLTLFANGEAGDRWTWFRDWCYTRSVGGVYERVTTTGDEIARVVGRYNGINYEQITIAARPIYNEGGGLSWGEFNGTSHWMATAAIDFTGTDKMSVFAGVEKDNETTIELIVELSAARIDNSGAFTIAINTESSTQDYFFASRGDAANNANQSVATDNSQPLLAVLSLVCDISGDSVIGRVNGSQVGEATGDQGAGNFGNYPLYIGARAGMSLFFDGRMYDNIVRGAASTPEQITGTEAVQAKLAGVSL